MKSSAGMGLRSFTLAIVAVCLTLCLHGTAHAKLLQIIHTGGLHSHMEHSEDLSMGSYAALKAQMDKIRSEATQQGIETLTLDSGDFSEGTEFYLVDRGEASWRIVDAMGYDAVVMGNHEYLMGQDEMDRVVRNVQPKFQLIAANFHPNKNLHALRSYTRPFVEFTRAGLKIAVLGLTNDGFDAKMWAGSGGITSVSKAAKKYARRLKERNDLVIALTHIGTESDKELVRKTTGIDLVVAGDSEERLISCEMKDEQGKKVTVTPCQQIGPGGARVPIVQAGKYAEVVGDLLIDVEPGKPVRVVRYQLIPVWVDGPKDQRIEQMVSEARQKLEASYGRQWLIEVIGHSDVPLTRPTASNPTVAGNLVADAMREAVSADIAVSPADFFGDNQPAGPITREGLFNLYPRVFSFDERYGWTIWTTRVRGWILKAALKIAIGRGYPLTLSGASLDVRSGRGSQQIVSLSVDGAKIKPFKMYRVAIPEGLGRAIAEKVKISKLIFRHAKDTGVPIWQATEARVRGLGSIQAHVTP